VSIIRRRYDVEKEIAQLKNEAGKKCSNVQYSKIENMNITKKGDGENGDRGR
jgi:hypothetical protein